jgi:hypothetical protein
MHFVFRGSSLTLQCFIIFLECRLDLVSHCLEGLDFCCPTLNQHVALHRNDCGNITLQRIILALQLGLCVHIGVNNVLSPLSPILGTTFSIQ